ncbi:MAG: hypothetical protein J6Y39_07895 [Bacteroidaceae bacterium]|nr:hypothetical protein [Bacteroidaceae bacterium]
MTRKLMTLTIALLAWTGMNAMDYETARERAYYLTDKMAYELNLNDQQYNDAYEINLDYLLSLSNETDIDGMYLTYRNEDLRHILYDWQWATFAAADYFYRPVWWYNGGWYFPIFNYYARGHFYYHRPAIFWDYRGGHGRIHFAAGYYHDRRPAWRGGFRGMHRSTHPHNGIARGGAGRDHHGTPSHREHFGTSSHRGQFGGSSSRRENFGSSSSRREHFGTRSNGTHNRENTMRSSSHTTVTSRPNSTSHSSAGHSFGSHQGSTSRPSGHTPSMGSGSRSHSSSHSHMGGAPSGRSHSGGAAHSSGRGGRR